jgi:3-hydroxyacyl-CoA dehydrogenase
MNTIGGDVLQAINKAIDRKEYQGLVIVIKENSVGANIGMIFMMAEQEYDELIWLSRCSKIR